MNVSQALTQKNKIVVEIKKQYAIAQKFNSQEEGNPRRYKIEDALNKAEELTKDLIELKTKIHLSNAPVYGEIFKMAELKGQIKELKKIPVDEGKQEGRYGSPASVKEVEINVQQIDDKVRKLEANIELIQDILNYHNTTTELK